MNIVDEILTKSRACSALIPTTKESHAREYAWGGGGLNKRLLLKLSIYQTENNLKNQEMLLN